jgi:divalent metal cation (Fe/Co/Zn/Cd) transporter
MAVNKLVHDLHIRKAGRQTIVTFHLVVPGSITVSKAQDICDELETVIKKVLLGAFTAIQIEPMKMRIIRVLL